LVTTPDSKETVIPIELNDGGLNVLLHDQGIGVEVPEFIEVNPQDTIECIQKMTEGEWTWISQGDIFKMCSRRLLVSPI
jgi:hypothetical protein